MTEKSVPRVEDLRFLRGEGEFVGNVKLPGQVYATFVRSVMAHARIESIDLTEARSMPGVLGVFTASDLGLSDIPPFFEADQRHSRPPLARDTVRFVGEPIVVVVAESVAQGQDAAALVVVELDRLKPVLTVRDSRDGVVTLHAHAGTNLSFEMKPDRDLSFDECEVLVDIELVNQRLAACPIEPRVAAATWEDGRLIHYASSQGSHPVRDALASLYGLDKSDVRVITLDVGGGFGAKGTPHAEELLVGALARAVDRPVMWSESRSENMVGMVHGRAQHQRVRMGGTSDGHITHYALDILQDAGAYPRIGACTPDYTRRVFTGAYDIDNAAIGAHSYVTSTTPIGAYRGAGRPEAAAAIERAIDVYATEIGLDPVTVRRRNLIPANAFPYSTHGRSTYDSGDYEAALDQVLATAGYDELRFEQARRRAVDDPVMMGIGVAVYVENTGRDGGSEFASIELLPGGSALVRTGSTPCGQGHETTWAMLVSQCTGIPIDQITVSNGDTDDIPHGNVTAGSRSAQIVGSSVWSAAEHLVEMGRACAAELLEATKDDVAHNPTEGGEFYAIRTPARRIGWKAIAAAAGDGEPLTASSTFTQDGATFAFGAHVAVVDIDSETGGVTLRRMVACDDAGSIINPILADGQVHGGLAQGIAQALFEAVEYDQHGNPLTTNLVDYTVISATELPRFERVPMETPTPLNPLGAKGIGESATIGSTPAVHNAVCDALTPLGIHHIDMPCTPMRIWNAINRAKYDPTK